MPNGLEPPMRDGLDSSDLSVKRLVEERSNIQLVTRQLSSNPEKANQYVDLQLLLVRSATDENIPI